MKEIKIKICGMTNLQNVTEVADLKPEYMGFILYHGSPRYVSLETAATLTKDLTSSILKVAVLVNESFEKALKIAQSGYFDLIQLHGNEDVGYCRKLSNQIQIIKAFSVGKSLTIDLAAYQEFCEMFLFDTSGELPGGSGKSFDHRILSTYLLEKDFILAGGISPTDTNKIRSIRQERLAAVDLNSRFELSPGIKDIRLLKNFIEKLREYES
jgi:phosphoribosylanthranilate isomerase